jgi:hypothetical protein
LLLNEPPRRSLRCAFGKAKPTRARGTPSFNLADRRVQSEGTYDEQNSSGVPSLSTSTRSPLLPFWLPHDRSPSSLGIRDANFALSVLLHTSRTSWHKLSQAITAAKLNRRAPAKARHDDYHVKKMCRDLMETFTLVYLVRPSIHRIASTTRICMVVKVTVFPRFLLRSSEWWCLLYLVSPPRAKDGSNRVKQWAAS